MSRKQILASVLVALLCLPQSLGATLQPIKGVEWLPMPLWPAATAPAFSTVQLDAATDHSTLVFRSPVTCNYDQVTFGVGTVTTAAALDARIETVSTTTANPTGTLWAANTSATLATPTSNTQPILTLTASASFTRGQIGALAIRPGATPIDLLINRVGGNTIGGGGSFPYGSFNTTGTDAGSANIPTYGLRCSTGEWVYLGDGVVPAKAFATSVFNTGTSATTGTRRCLRFQVPYPRRISSVGFKASVANGADYSLILYDTGGTALQTLATVDGNNTGGASAQQHLIYTDSDYTIAKDTEYHLCIVPSTANSVTLYEFSVETAAHMDAFPGGQQFFLSKFVSGAWVEVTTERPYIFIGFSAADDGAAGGSSVKRVIGG